MTVLIFGSEASTGDPFAPINVTLLAGASAGAENPISSVISEYLPDFDILMISLKSFHFQRAINSK